MISNREFIYQTCTKQVYITPRNKKMKGKKCNEKKNTHTNKNKNKNKNTTKSKSKKHLINKEKKMKNKKNEKKNKNDYSMVIGFCMDYLEKHCPDTLQVQSILTQNNIRNLFHGSR